MAQFSFCLEINFPGVDDEFEAADSVYDSGGDDTLVHSIDGRVYVDYDREAGSYGEAVRTAIEQIESICGKVVDIQRIAPVVTPEEVINMATDTVLKYAGQAGRYAENVAKSGIDFFERFKTALTPEEPEPEEPDEVVDETP